MSVRNRTESTLSDQFSDAIDWKRQVGISAHPGVIEGITVMGIDQLRHRSVAGDLSEADITPSDGIVEWLLLG
jgi:hypothetical protein